MGLQEAGGALDLQARAWWARELFAGQRARGQDNATRGVREHMKPLECGQRVGRPSGLPAGAPGELCASPPPNLPPLLAPASSSCWSAGERVSERASERAKVLAARSAWPPLSPTCTPPATLNSIQFRPLEWCHKLASQPASQPTRLLAKQLASWPIRSFALRQARRLVSALLLRLHCERAK